ncbi:MAG: rhodanese-like domain-containing protein [Nitrospirae bacterium]|nr:rhodanese-like domain-containing protein [Nitrospirota bacterium]
MVNKRMRLFVLTSMIAMVLLGTAGLSFAEKPTVLAPCKQCHQPEKDLVRGTLVSVSEKFKTINVQVGQKLVWIINYGDDLKITGADKLLSVSKDKEIGIRFTGDEKKPYAVSLTVKPPAKVAPEKLVTADEISKLVAMGPEKGSYLLVDSRPKPRFNEGHIPHAVSLDNTKFDELKDKMLPKEKDRLIIFYCGGVT